VTTKAKRERDSANVGHLLESALFGRYAGRMVDSSDVSAHAGQPESAAGRGRVTDERGSVAVRRGRGGQGRTRKLTVRFSDSEFAAVLEAANGHPSSWIREVAVAVATGPKAGSSELSSEREPAQRGRGGVAAQQQMLEVMKARAVLAAIGNNVNQIAKGINAGQPLESDQAAAMFRFLRSKVNILDAEVRRLRVVSES